MKLDFPYFAVSCLRTLENNGFEAWFVGGSVRDCLLGRDFYDIDIATSALPDEVEAVFPHTVPTGKKHGTITVLMDKEPIEVTTYRSDADYIDGRHPDCVTFKKDIAEDLSRRDFTVNAFAYNPKRGLLDLFGGRTDLEKRIIKAVGDAETRFNEDALRILRAFRFASVLEFLIEENTIKAAYICGENLSKLSGERVLSELSRLAEGKNPAIIADFVGSGYLKSFGVGQNIYNIDKILPLRDRYKAAAFFSCFEINEELFEKSLKPDKKLLSDIKLFASFKNEEIPSDKTGLKKIFNRYGNEEAYIEFVRFVAGNEYADKIEAMYNEIILNSEPYLIRHLALNGNDLLKAGFFGEEIGQKLSELTSLVIEDPAKNDKNTLIDYLKANM